ncbi:MAG: hypothetical protein U0401_33005 [Anaerolineae bacterium]
MEQEALKYLQAANSRCKTRLADARAVYGTSFLPKLPEEGEGQLLNLIHQKNNIINKAKMTDKILLAVSIVMFKVIPLILEEVLKVSFSIFSGHVTSHQVKEVEFGLRQIGNPAKMLDFVSLDFPIFNKVDQHILIAAVQRHLVDETKTMGHALTGHFILCTLPGLVSLFHLLKQKGGLLL